MFRCSLRHQGKDEPTKNRDQCADRFYSYWGKLKKGLTRSRALTPFLMLVLPFL